MLTTWVSVDIAVLARFALSEVEART